jgi:hypothetical protein
LEITGGNAEVAENRGIAKRAIRKLMQEKKLKIDNARPKRRKEDLPQRHRDTEKSDGFEPIARKELRSEIADGVAAKRLSSRDGYFM